MPFDLLDGARRLRERHGDRQSFRHALLDLLFAIGSPVREQALALEFGDTLGMEVVGPAAPSLEPPLVLVVVDVEPPHLPSVSRAAGRPAAWAPELASLGGPTTAVAWAACLHALASSTSQRPWRAHYVRGPAAGVAASLGFLIGELEPEAEVVQVVTSVRAQPITGPVDLMRIDLTRSRNVWRFPACDHSYALSSDLPWATAATALSELVEGLGPEINWTLHDLHIYQADLVHLSAVLRTSAQIPKQIGGFTTLEVDANQRLMFPVNDALGGLRSLASRFAGVWGKAMHQPLHLHVLPGGLSAFTLVPSTPQPALPARAGSLSLTWHREPLIAAPPSAVLPFVVGQDEHLGPIPAGLDGRTNMVWQLPPLVTDDDLPGVLRALGAAVSDV